MDDTVSAPPLATSESTLPPVSNNQSPSPKSEHLLRWSLVAGIVVVIILCLVGGVSYYMGSQGSKKEAITKVSPSPTQQPIETPVPIANKIAEIDKNKLKTYTNNALGISLQYPEELYSVKVYKLSDQGENLGKEYITLEPNDAFNNHQPPEVTYAVSIAAVPNKNNYSLTTPKDLFGSGTLMSYVPELLGNTPINETTLGGMKAFRVNGCCGGVSGIEADIQTIRDGKVYQVLVEPKQVAGDENVNKEIYEKIVSSFTFIQ